MTKHFLIHSRNCILCYGLVQGGFLVACEGTSLLPVLSSSTCPNQACPICKKASLAFLAHSICLSIFRQITGENFDEVNRTSALKRFWNLGQALLPLSPEPYTIWSTNKTLPSSFCRGTLARILTTVEFRHQDEDARAAYGSFFSRLSSLSEELLQIVASSIIDERCLWINVFGDTFRILKELETNCARQFSLSSEDAIFATQIRIGGTTYITGLYNEPVEKSVLIKPATVRAGIAIIWLDIIGITRVEFYSSIDLITPRQCGQEWLYAIALSDRIQVQSKGVFLADFDNTAVEKRNVCWDSLKAPLLQGPQLPESLTGDKIFLHYVSLENTIGVSFAFDSVHLLAIVAHRGASNHGASYSKVMDKATWVHCPLRSKTEKVLEIWSIQHRIQALGWRAFIIRTNTKMIWLGAAFLSEEFHELINTAPMSLQSVCALYYNACNAPGDRVVGAISEGGRDRSLNATAPPWPPYRTPRPNWDRGDKLEWFYSEASLESVEQIRLCVSDGLCIGLRLQYKEYDSILGQYRLDRELGEPFHNPRWGGFVEHRNSLGKPGIQITFSQCMPMDHGWNTFRMSGIMCWWFGPGKPEVAIVQ